MASLFKGNLPEGDFLSLSEVAKRLGVQEDVIEYLTKEGKLTAHLKDGVLKYEKRAIDLYLKKMSNQDERRAGSKDLSWQEGSPSRRESERSNMDLACEIRVQIPEKKKNLILKAVIRNISHQGIYLEEMMLLKGSGKLEVGDSVVVKIGQLAEMQGDVVRLYGRRKEDTGKGFLGMGIYLHGLSEENLEKVKGLTKK